MVWHKWILVSPWEEFTVNVGRFGGIVNDLFTDLSGTCGNPLTLCNFMQIQQQ